VTGSWWATTLEVAATLLVAATVSWLLTKTMPRVMRRIARRGAGVDGPVHHARHHASARGAEADPRLLQRADGMARLTGRVLTLLIMNVAAIVALDRLGIDLVVVLSSAGFLGVAIAFGGQGAIRDLLAGSRALLEDRYAIGDDVVVRVDGLDVRGTVDLVGAASIRLRLVDGSAWYAGHDAIECVTNYSQTPVTTVIALRADEWDRIDPDDAAARLVASSNDIDLTGVVFLRDLETRPGETDEEVSVCVRSNRPLRHGEQAIVREQLLGRHRRSRQVGGSR
jgi:hypothetical protein